MTRAEYLKELIDLTSDEIKFMFKNIDLENYEKIHGEIKFEGIEIGAKKEIIFVFQTSNEQFYLSEEETLLPNEIIAMDIDENIPRNYQIRSTIEHTSYGNKYYNFIVSQDNTWLDPDDPKNT